MWIPVTIRALARLSMLALLAALALLPRLGEGKAGPDDVNSFGRGAAPVSQPTADVAHQPGATPVGQTYASSVEQLSARPPGLAAAPVALPAPTSDSGGLASVELSARQDGAALIYAIRLRNDSNRDISNLYVAGSLAEGATLNAAWTPMGSTFNGPQRGLVSWQVPSLSAGASAGPFQYSVGVRTGGPTTAVAFVHWSDPADGAAISGLVTVQAPSGSTIQEDGARMDSEKDQGKSKAKGKNEQGNKNEGD